MPVEQSSTYQEFLKRKSQSDLYSGFDPVWMPDFLFDFQQSLVDWSIRKGKAALFEDCGLGKSPQALVWCENIIRKTNKPALILAPLAVSSQFVREAEKFNIDCKRSQDGTVHSNITVTNYQRLHYFNPDDFAGIVCDESSALKAFDGKTRKQVTRFLSKVPYRLLGTATAAPNDFIELGTSSEALGELTQSEMLSTFFKSSDNMRHSLFREGDFWNRVKWFFRPHSETPFWRWVCSWARALRKPSDIGFDDARFILPELIINQHIVGADFCFPGELYPRIARTLKEQRVERKRTMIERCEKVAELVNHGESAVVWCQYNEEGDILERLRPDAIQVAGQDSDDLKESRLVDFSIRRERGLLMKPKIGAFGLNWQHCGHQVYFPSHSFEQWYQGIRRSLRFGRVGPVRVDIVTTEGEAGVTANLQNKAVKAEQMFQALVAEMNRGTKMVIPNLHVNQMEAPVWPS